MAEIWTVSDWSIGDADPATFVAAFQRLLKETGGEPTVAMARERLPITHFVGRFIAAAFS